MNSNIWISITKGLKTFAVSLTVLILGGVIQALGNFHPDPGIATTLWTAFGAAIIGGIVSLMNWVKNLNTTTVVTKTADTMTTTTIKPT